MKISQFKKEFFESLEQEYPRTELESFFNLLAEKYFSMNRLQIALQPEKEITERELEIFKKGIFRLKNHEPVQYILGETEFFGLPFKVDKRVLIPRPETEELVEWILLDAEMRQKKLKILDIGTGSGCIAISLAKNLPDSNVFALDISRDALEVAQENAEINGVKINFMENDIFGCPGFEEIFDIIVSNPPYVRELEKTEMQANVLKNEPEMALYVKDEDPLLFYRKITKLAKSALDKNGKLYFEINQYLSEETVALLENDGFETELKKDIFGNFRMLKGTPKGDFC